MSNEITVSLFRDHGLSGFYIGFSATIFREIPFALIQFPLWERLKISLRSSRLLESDAAIGAVSGFVAGSVAAFLTTPLDVVKTRRMLATGHRDVKQSLIEILSDCYSAQNGGLRALFRGCWARVSWIGLGGFIYLDFIQALLMWSTSEIVNIVFPQSYQGSRLLQPQADLISVPIDHLNFFVGQIVALCVAIAYRNLLPPPPQDSSPEVKQTRVQQRHLFSLFVGLIIAVFCYGVGSLHLLWQTLLVYVLLKLVPDQPWVISISCLAYLGFLHLSRLRNDYLKYTIDPTGSLMISTQKLTALAFCLNDFSRSKKDNEEGQTMDRKRQMVTRVPTLLEMLSFTCNFHGVLAGPLTFYNDYDHFVAGTDQLMDFDPSTMGKPYWAVAVKCVQAGLFVMLYLFLRC